VGKAEHIPTTLVHIPQPSAVANLLFRPFLELSGRFEPSILLFSIWLWRTWFSIFWTAHTAKRRAYHDHDQGTGGLCVAFRDDDVMIDGFKTETRGRNLLSFPQRCS